MTTAGCNARFRMGFGQFAIDFTAAIASALVGLCLPTGVLGQPAPMGQPAPAAAPVAQFNGNKVQLPAKRPTSRMSGLSLTVDPRWTNSYGYRPVEVTITSPKAATVDHQVTIRLHTGWNRNVTAEQDFELPLGSNSATTSISLPTYQTPMNYFWWEVWVDGIKDKDLSVDRISSLAWMGGTSGSGAGLTFLVAGPNSKHRSLVATNAMELEVLSLKLSAFPTRWIDYSALDVVALSRSEVQQLATQHPATWEAIYRWVRTGGALWVSDAGAQLEHLPEISKLFHLPDVMAATDTQSAAVDKAAKADSKQEKADGKAEDGADEHKVQVGWHPLRFRRGNSDGRVDPSTVGSAAATSGFSDDQIDPSVRGRRRRFATDSNASFVEQSLGLGTVRAFRGANEVAQFPLTPATGNLTMGTANPNAVPNSDGSDQLPPALAVVLRGTEHWDARHGMTPDSANMEFAKFLVPGVGLAPVTEFRILITLFVLLIGPLNYWWLKRSKRLHLMVLTVPLAAAVTTAALFGYAIVADGFDTRVRAQSYTKLDQRTGDAACWTRLSYYSGLSPGKGLTMPADLIMLPILPAWAGDVNLAEERSMVWEANGARLTQGWLNSRTPTQYLTVRSRKSPHQLEVLDSGDKLRVKNQLGAKIKSLLVINEAGKIYAGEDVASESSAVLQPIERTDAVRRINRLIMDNLPKAPDALGTSESQQSALQSRARYPMYGRNGLQYNAGRLSENLAGVALSNLAGLSGRPALELPPRSYVAITETGPEVEIGISYAKEEASFHLIEGRY